MTSLPLDFVKNSTNMHRAVSEVSEFFSQSNETVSEFKSQGTLHKLRAYSFLFPCTTFFTYGRGIMFCSVTSRVKDDDCHVQAHFGTVDDSEVDFTCHCRNEEECIELYEYLKKTLHKSGLMGYDSSDRFTNEDFKTWAQLLIDQGGFQSKATLTFWFN